MPPEANEPIKAFRHLSQTAIPITVTIALLTLAALWLSERLILLSDIEQYLVDYRIRNGRLAVRDPDLIFVSVDKTSYAGDFPDKLVQDADADDQYFMSLLRGEWPWSRELWGHVSDRLINAGAKGVLLDFVFPSEKPEDAELKAILDRHGPRIIVGALIDHNADQISIIPPTPSLIGPEADGGNMNDPRVGLLNLQTDRDGVVRRALFSVDLDQFAAASLGAKLEEVPTVATSVFHTAPARAARLINPSVKSSPTTRLPMMRFAGPPETFRPISLKRLIDPEEWRTQFADTGFFRDKFVVIGPGSAILNDDHRTPFNTRGSKMIGSEVRLNEINAALHGELLVESSRTANRGVILVAGLASLALSLGFRDSRVKLGLAICVSAGFVAAAMALANQGNYMLSVLFTPLALFNGGILLDRFLPGRITSAAAATIPPTRPPES